MQNQVAWIGCGLGRVLGASQAAIAGGWRFLRNLAVTLLLVAPLAPASAQGPLWVRQIGSAGQDWAYGLALDGAGNAYITGYTQGNLGGPNAGSGDIFLAKYDASGTLLWTRQTGSLRDEVATGVAVDGTGNAYITGYTWGNLGGLDAGGGETADIFLAKYDASGTLLWMRQTGTAAREEPIGVAVDGDGNAFITGYTNGNLGGPNAGEIDIFLAKYDPSGTLLWIRQTGTATTDISHGVAVDGAGNAFIAGRTLGNLSGPNAGEFDIFLAKYDASGTLLWTRQTGTASGELAFGVAVDSAGNAYITGYTQGNLGGPNAGSDDIFLAKYDASGSLLWIRQTGTAQNDVAYGVALDGAGNAFITGYTNGNLGGPNAGEIDIFLAKYDATGVQLSMRQTGSAGYESAFSVAVDVAGNAYITGYSNGSLGGPNAGEYDIVLAKYGPPCTAPTITTNPTATNICRTTTATLNVAATATTSVTYRWRKAGVPIDIVANPSAATDTLRLGRVQAGDAGFYDCIVSTDCGSVTSGAARLTVRTCICLEADIAGGGDAGNEPDGTVDGTDFIAFINSFALGDAAVDPLADIAGGGDTGLEPDGTIDGTDFIFFINAFAIGC